MVLNVDVAHIRGAHQNGPRYVPTMTDEERRQFGNLLLMCRAHHRVIDIIRRDNYTIDQLETWKRNRERKSYAVLRTVLVPDDQNLLQDVLTEAIKLQARELEKQVTRFESALARLAEIDEGAADLVRQRVEAASEMQRAADKLAHTEDTSIILQSASRSLAHTQDTAILLLSAADALRQIPDTADELTSAALHANDAYEILSAIDRQLSQRIKELRDLRDDW